MGITLSISRHKEHILSLPFHHVQNLIKSYKHFLNPVEMELLSLKSLFLHSSKSSKLTLENQELISFLWSTYNVGLVCYIQEALFVLIINSDSDWNQRFDLLFDLFVCVGSEELAYDDVCQACLTVAKSIHRLCVAPKDEDILATNGGDDVVHLWKHAEWIYIVEALVKEAFLKLSKEIEDGLSKEDFIRWCIWRFDEKCLVSSPETLQHIYKSHSI